jgi:hypothetical protein
VVAGRGFFTFRRVDEDVTAEQSFAEFERQQAVLLRVLFRRQGRGVSFAELQDAGVEFPASVVSELELEDVPIERCVLRADGTRTVGVRLDAAWFGPPAPEPSLPVDGRTVGEAGRTGDDARRTDGEERRSHDRFANTLARCRHAQRLLVMWAAAVCWMLAAAVIYLRDRLRDLHAGDRLRDLHLGDRLRDLRLQERARDLHLSDRLRDLRLSDRFRELHLGDHLRNLRLQERARDLHLGDHVRELQLGDRLRGLHLHDRIGELHLREQLRDLHLQDRLGALQLHDRLRTSAQWMSSHARKRRLLALATVLAVVGVIVALAVGQLDTGIGRTPSAHAHARAPVYAAGSTHTRKARHTVPPVHVPVSPTLAAELQLKGHELLGAGQYTQAAQLLHRALAASGENVQRCLQPVSEACLTYAYALYDLGRALMLSGSPAAVPVLERRLQIENQRPTVAVALEQARARTG